MKKELRDKWVAALRSGKFEQGHGDLCSEGRYCCLGVLAELEGKLVECDETKKGVVYKCGYNTCMLPDPVLVEFGLDRDVAFVLAGMNDGEYNNSHIDPDHNDFNEIADYIEDNL